MPSIDLSSMGPAAAAAVIVYLFLKFLKDVMAKLTLSIEKNTQATVTNTKANKEVLKFMKNLNGKLAKAANQTIKEQKIEHQHVEVQTNAEG